MSIKIRIGMLGLALIAAACGSADLADDLADSGEGDVAAEAVGAETASGEAVELDEPAIEEELEEAAPRGVDPQSIADRAQAMFVDDAEPLTQWFAALEPGTYQTFALGTELSFSAEEALSTQFNGRGMFVLTDLNSNGPDDQDIVFLRTTDFVAPTAMNALIGEGELWPSSDFRGWVENLPDGVIASEPDEVKLGGLDAISIELELGDVECGYMQGACLGFAGNNTSDIKALSIGSQYRIWYVDQGDSAPITVTVAINSEDDSDWWDRADAVLDTVAFGEVGRNPSIAIGPNPMQVDMLGGVELTSPDERTLFTDYNARGYRLIAFLDNASLIDFLDTPLSLTGEPISTSDEVVEAIVTAGGVLTELEPATVGGAPARVFDFSSEAIGAVAVKANVRDLPVSHLGWDLSETGRVWIIEHPDRGVQMIGAKTYESSGEFFPATLELAEQIIASLEYIDLE